MRLYKFLLAGMFVTLMAIGFVHQRVEIVKTGYGLQKNRQYLSYLVDQNSRLAYDLSKLESPRHLLASLEGEEIEFAGTSARRGASYRIARLDTGNAAAGEGFIAKLLDLFTLSAEARPRE